MLFGLIGRRRNNPLQRLTKGKIEDIGEDIHRRPQHDINAIACQPEHPCIGRLGYDFDQCAEPRDRRQPRAFGDIIFAD